MLKKTVDIICDMLYCKDARREEIRKEEIGEEAFPMYSDEPVQNLGRGVRGEYAADRKAVSFFQ